MTSVPTRHAPRSNPRQAFTPLTTQLRHAWITESDGHCYVMSGSAAFLAFHLGEILSVDPLTSVTWER